MVRAAAEDTGSSPHTRGAQLIRGVIREHERIIPAYAGSTRTPESPPAAPTGSSPHTRGAPCTTTKLSAAAGIIPAYAGSTSGTNSFSCRAWDHPRIRGEHERAVRAPVRAVGSSPHTRGALQLVDFRVVGAGIIPAYAGSTCRGARVKNSTRDHPRIRGEHFPHVHTVSRLMGSSPHTRGAH